MTESRALLSTEGGVIDTCITCAPEGHPGTLAAVVLHPWAMLGGCMDDPVVYTVCRALMATGAFHCVVRFNMRGAGRTSYRGSPAGVSELREVVQHLLDLPSLQQQQEQQQQQRQPGGKPQLYVVGYSYGSCIAAHAMQAFPEQVAGYVGIGFPLGFWSNLLLSSRTSWQQLEGTRVPKLLITGDADNFTDLQLSQEYVQQLQQQAGQQVALEVVRGADHFFRDQCSEVAQLVCDWVMQQEEAQGAGQ